MTMMLVVVLLAVAAVLMMYPSRRPQPVKARRNRLQEELLDRHRRRFDRY